MQVSTGSPSTENILIYDGDCFFCSNYVRLLKLKETIGDIRLINARDRAAVEGFGIRPADLNQGMVLFLEGKSYFGAEVIHHLALLSTGSTAFNKMNHAVFQNRYTAHLLYPLLKLGRRTYLFLSRKTLIQ